MPLFNAGIVIVSFGTTSEFDSLYRLLINGLKDHMADDQNEEFEGTPERNAAADNPTAKQYGADHITVLEGIEAVLNTCDLYRRQWS